ncbi:alpha/beta fold hydrolase [Arthrobacter bambusae]|uniref:alpha/beta fold hydrolase n=1 Tax=Arthrobacter bambusae TaxID=1338426 RepID=UPI0027835482|nr:alpha/beta hydrolase [Arthrobacter bambusae]MDQ0029043.1 pimeloyl-ACP methyl ester carboxylesterase [Arthrobacter bambusae]MDQ0098555.1 pimeloyl-ACP methyl ester carboxylesterase [Arthrobacter bambusae]
MNPPEAPTTRPSPSYQNAPTQSVRVASDDFVYRELGPRGGVPLVMLHHFAANLDDWDPRVVDGLAANRHTIAFDNRGVGASTGTTPDTVEEMAADAIAFIRALGHDQVDLLGFSLGGFVTQAIAQTDPGLIRRIILAGTAPAGGSGIAKIRRSSVLPTIKGILRRRHPKYYLFFTGTTNGRRAAQAYLDHLTARRKDRDQPVASSAFNAQLKAILRWGRQSPQDLAGVRHPVLVANGETDVMVPSQNTLDLAERLPNGELVPLYRDAGHGAIFQYHGEFVASALAFLERTN